MKKQKNLDYFIGFDIGTNSTGYAVSDTNYDLIKYQQHPMWGVHLFETAKLAEERRTHRAARRRLDRRQQRIQLLRELFSVEIGKVDRNFFRRIDSSSLKKDSSEPRFAIFADSEYTDTDFYKQYPTIHHLISELIDSDSPHDVRLVYLACAWLVVHRGHFFSEVAKEKVDELIDFQSVYNDLETYVEDNGYIFSWKHLDIKINEAGNILKSSATRSNKEKKLVELLQVKKSKKSQNNEDLPWIDENEFLRLLCGLESKAAKLFPSSEYEDIKLQLDSDDEKIEEMLSELSEEDSALMLLMKKVFDWSILADIIGGGKNISDAKVKIYEKHKSDLKHLKYLVKKYLTHQDFQEIFRNEKSEVNYAAYIGAAKKRANAEDFYKFLKSKLKNMKIEDVSDQRIFKQIEQDISAEKILPKQVDSDNRTIPYQLYWNELNNLLTKASGYLPFLPECDKDGLSVKDKILSLMEFRIPYFVGPLNAHSDFAWLERKADGKILPWNFEKKVDLDASEEAFIKHMCNKCTYLPGEDVLPKHSLLYQRFEVLNLLNTIHINGAPVTTESKQLLYDLFFKYSKVSKKTILNCLKSNNLYHDLDECSITGIDDTIPVSLSSWKIFKPFFEEKKLTESEAEEIIHKRSFTEDNLRFRIFLKKFPKLSNDDVKKLSFKNFQGFGRLSRKFLTEPGHFDVKTGAKLSIINMMWEYNLNLQQLMSDKYPFRKMVESARREYYSEKPQTLTKRLDDMYVSNAVKRPIIRTFAILDEIVKTMGKSPRKILVEMARDVDSKEKGKRKLSRIANLKKLYEKIADDDIRRLSKELDSYDESALQKDTLYLYFMQLGRDMYTGEPISIADLSLCNKEHIYPQSKVKDDSLLNNLVLVRSEINGAKSDSYPLDADIRRKMIPFWKTLKDRGLISDEKFFRLTRSTPFSEDEKWGFINRQLVETRQSTKVITELLKERYPDTEIVYVKAGLVSDFRHAFDLVKSRTVNDLHHGKDAYLNIVVGNVWHEYFTRNWFMEHSDEYSVKTKVVFGEKSYLKNMRGEQIWDGSRNISQVKNILKRNYLHLTNYTFCQHGGLFDQNPMPATAGLIPLKNGKPTEIYGGYRKAAATFFTFALTEEIAKKKIKKELTLVPVDLMIADKFLKDEVFALEYVKAFIDPTGKKEFSVKFPLGIKPIKIKTVFEVNNGLRFILNGKSGGGSLLGIGIGSPLLLDSDWERYIKRLESFCEKKRKDPKFVYVEKYDNFSCTENIQLYDLLTEKLRTGLFSKRPANPLECLEKGRDKFIALAPEKQAEILLGIVGCLGRSSGAGVDLSLLGGVAKAAVTTLSSKFSNWKKTFTTARIVNSDASGLHETKSINLLDLI